MRLPFIFRADHDALMSAMSANLASREELITQLRAMLKDKSAEIEALTGILTKCNDYTQKDPEKRKFPVPIETGRGGWRARAERASVATIPPPSDSAQALEKRVKEQGGTV